MVNVGKVCEVAKKVAPVVVAAAISAGSYVIGKKKGITEGIRKGYEKASKEYSQKFQDMLDRFERYKKNKN